MREYKMQERVEYDKVDLSATCNCCGEHFTYDPNKPITKAWQNKVHNFEFSGQYGSTYENLNVQFDLCDKCLEQIFSTFKYKPDYRGVHI
jgi:hypothetical protein